MGLFVFELEAETETTENCRFRDSYVTSSVWEQVMYLRSTIYTDDARKLQILACKIGENLATL